MLYHQKDAFNGELPGFETRRKHWWQEAIDKNNIENVPPNVVNGLDNAHEIPNTTERPGLRTCDSLQIDFANRDVVQLDSSGGTVTNTVRGIKLANFYWIFRGVDPCSLFLIRYSENKARPRTELRYKICPG